MDNRENQGRVGSNRQQPAGGTPRRSTVPRTQRPTTPQQRQTAGVSRQPARPPKKQKGNRWFRAILMVLTTLAACIFLSFFILRSASDLFGLNQEDRVIPVVIPENPTVSQVTDILTGSGVVEQPLTFRLYADLKVEAGEFKGGEYNFNTNLSYDQIFAALRKGNDESKEVTVTFIEGTTLYEFAMKLEENEVCNADEFLEYLDSMSPEDHDYDFLAQIPESNLRFRNLEGYIFPDTYDFYINEKVSSVADKFLGTFESKFTSSMRERMDELNMTLDEVITLASIIQKEAGEEDHMQRVSAVFHNRLGRPDLYPKLQSDVTIHYVEKFIKPFLATDNQAMYDAYNTYVCNGLPVGPICNPGLDAIQAALNPANSSNYFFVTDSEGIYYYAESAQQHYQNVVKAEAVGGEDIHGTDTTRD